MTIIVQDWQLSLKLFVEVKFTDPHAVSASYWQHTTNVYHKHASRTNPLRIKKLRIPETQTLSPCGVACLGWTTLYMIGGSVPMDYVF